MIVIFKLSLVRFLCLSRKFFPVIFCFIAIGCSVDEKKFVFSAKVLGPVSNIYSVSESGRVNKITNNILWRDVDADISPQGAVVFASNREEQVAVDLNKISESFNVYLSDDKGESLKRLTNSPENEMAPRFSPDGESVAYLRDRSQLVVLDLRLNKEHVVYEDHEILDFDWNFNGDAIAIAARDLKHGKVLVAECQSSCVKHPVSIKKLKSFQRLTGRHTESSGRNCKECGSAVAVSWSPQGDQLAFIFHPDYAGIRTLQALATASGNLIQVSKSGEQVQSPVSWSTDGSSLLYAALEDYAFYYDESKHRKVYRGNMRIFRADISGRHEVITGEDVVARAPMFVDDDRVAYLQADQFGAREYALVVKDLGDGSEVNVFDRVSRSSGLAVIQ